MKKLLFVGIGNPGNLYKNNRHNVGAILLSSMFNDISLILNIEKKYNCKIDLLTCCSYVNTTGDFISTYSADCIMVFVDDMETSLGKVKFTYPTLGHKGHNGIRNIMKYFKNQFCSIRIGIGRPPSKINVDDFVLSNLTYEEKQTILNLSSNVYDELIKFIESLLLYEKKE